MEFEFTMGKRTYQATRERVIEALRDVVPVPATPCMVVVEGTAYPMRQAFGETFGVDRKLMGTVSVQRVFERLGFEVTAGGTMEIRPWPTPAENPKPPVWRPKRRFEKHREELATDELAMPTIWLRWSYSERWEDVANGGANCEGMEMPPNEPGVYQVRCRGQYEKLYIGRASDLRSRVCYGLIAGTAPHAAGQKIRENENLADLWLQWAVTDHPAAAEEELHRRHIDKYGRLPKYTLRT